MDTGLRQRLANQLATGQVILFTGAGFSMSALNDGGANIPGVSQLRYLLWPLAFGSAPIDDTSTLADIYEVAAAQAGGKVRALLQKGSSTIYVGNLKSSLPAIR